MIRLLRKEFFITLFWKQNNWHRHGVFIHTMKVCYHLLRNNQYNMLLAGLLHDIGKPIIAFQDSKDLLQGTYSFVNHEEVSYRVIRNWKFVSKRTKSLVRWHYIIRDLQKCLEKGKFARYRRLSKIWNRLDEDLREDLRMFLKCDDLGKN